MADNRHDQHNRQPYVPQRLSFVADDGGAAAAAAPRESAMPLPPRQSQRVCVLAPGRVVVRLQLVYLAPRQVLLLVAAVVVVCVAADYLVVSVNIAANKL